MPRKKVEPKDNRNRYTLREGMTLKEGDVIVTGPEFIYRSLDAAFLIKHKLEEQDEIIAKVEERRKQREGKRRNDKREAMYEAVGETPPGLDEVGK